MRKYLEVFRWSFKAQIIWRFDVAMTMVATLGQIVAAWILWSAVFAGRELVSGFTFPSMLSYYLVGSLLMSLDMSSHISFEVSRLIKDGGFSKHMVTPMNPFGFFAFQIAGKSAFHLGFSLLAAILCAGLFHIPIALSPDAARLLLGAAMALLGLLFMAGYHYLIGILAFRFVEMEFFLYLQGAILAFATGTMVPLSLLPGPVARVLRLLPFPHVVFTPAMLLTGQMDIAEGLFCLAVLLLWVAAIVCVGQGLYHRLRTRYEGVGI